MIGSQILERIGKELKPLEVRRKIGVVTSAKVGRLYSGAVVQPGKMVLIR
jgi:hypothetical protein